MVGSALMRRFATPTSVGVWQTFVVMGSLYLAAMLAGAFGYRLPPEGWTPAGWRRETTAATSRVAAHYVPVGVAWRTRQFWLLWAVLCLNVTAGIGILVVTV